MDEVRVWTGGGRDEAVRGPEQPAPVGPVEDRAQNLQAPECRISRCAVCCMGSGMSHFDNDVFERLLERARPYD